MIKISVDKDTNRLRVLLKGNPNHDEQGRFAEGPGNDESSKEISEKRFTPEEAASLWGHDNAFLVSPGGTKVYSVPGTADTGADHYDLVTRAVPDLFRPSGSNLSDIEIAVQRGWLRGRIEDNRLYLSVGEGKLLQHKNNIDTILDYRGDKWAVVEERKESGWGVNRRWVFGDSTSPGEPDIWSSVKKSWFRFRRGYRETQ